MPQQDACSMPFENFAAVPDAAALPAAAVMPAASSILWPFVIHLGVEAAAAPPATTAEGQPRRDETQQVEQLVCL